MTVRHKFRAVRHNQGTTCSVIRINRGGAFPYPNAELLELEVPYNSQDRNLEIEFKADGARYRSQFNTLGSWPRLRSLQVAKQPSHITYQGSESRFDSAHRGSRETLDIMLQLRNVVAARRTVFLMNYPNVP
jgi:hypothetical protein